MTPEFGGNSAYFPIDGQTIQYPRATGRSEDHVNFVERSAKRLGIWFDPSSQPRYISTLQIDLASIEPSLAGSRRPQDRIPVSETAPAIAGMKKGSVEVEILRTGGILPLILNKVAAKASNDVGQFVRTGTLVSN